MMSSEKLFLIVFFLFHIYAYSKKKVDLFSRSSWNLKLCWRQNAVNFKILQFSAKICIITSSLQKYSEFPEKILYKFRENQTGEFSKMIPEDFFTRIREDYLRKIWRIAHKNCGKFFKIYFLKFSSKVLRNFPSSFQNNLEICRIFFAYYRDFSQKICKILYKKGETYSLKILKHSPWQFWKILNKFRENQTGDYSKKIQKDFPQEFGRITYENSGKLSKRIFENFLRKF